MISSHKKTPSVKGRGQNLSVTTCYDIRIIAIDTVPDNGGMPSVPTAPPPNMQDAHNLHEMRMFSPKLGSDLH